MLTPVALSEGDLLLDQRCNLLELPTSGCSRSCGARGGLGGSGGAQACSPLDLLLERRCGPPELGHAAGGRRTGEGVHRGVGGELSRSSILVKASLHSHYISRHHVFSRAVKCLQ